MNKKDKIKLRKFYLKSNIEKIIKDGEKYEIDDIIINLGKFARNILKDEYYYKEIEKIIYFMFINKENINCVDKIYELMKKLAKKALKSNNTIYLIELIHKITEFSCMDRKEHGIIVMISGAFNSLLLDVLSFMVDQNETIVGVSSSGKIYKKTDPEYYEYHKDIPRSYDSIARMETIKREKKGIYDKKDVELCNRYHPIFEKIARLSHYQLNSNLLNSYLINEDNLYMISNKIVNAQDEGILSFFDDRPTDGKSFVIPGGILKDRRFIIPKGGVIIQFKEYLGDVIKEMRVEEIKKNIGYFILIKTTFRNNSEYTTYIRVDSDKLPNIVSEKLHNYIMVVLQDLYEIEETLLDYYEVIIPKKFRKKSQSKGITSNRKNFRRINRSRIMTEAVRKLPIGHQASPQAKKLAEESFVNLREGETFVREHIREYNKI